MVYDNNRQEDGQSQESGALTRRRMLAAAGFTGIGLMGSNSAAMGGTNGTQDGDGGGGSSQFGAIRIVGPQSKYNTISEAIESLPEDEDSPLDVKMGHVHVMPNYDDADESYPIHLHGNIALTTNPRRGAVLTPPAGGTGIVVDSEVNTTVPGGGWQGNKQTVYLRGFRMVHEGYDTYGDVSENSFPDTQVEVTGGVGTVIEYMDIRGFNEHGIFLTGHPEDYNRDGTTKPRERVYPISTAIRDVIIRGARPGGGGSPGKYGVRTDGSYPENHTTFWNVRSRDIAEDAFRLRTFGASYNLYGCTAEIYGRNGLRVEGARACNWYGGYMENTDESKDAIHYTDRSGVQSSGEVRGLYVNGARHVLVADTENHVKLSDINYYNVTDSIVYATNPNASVDSDPASYSACCGWDDSPPYAAKDAESLQAVRANGIYVHQDLTQTGATGEFAGDLARHDGSGDHPAGVYTWDDEQSAWIGPDGSTV